MPPHSSNNNLSSSSVLAQFTGDMCVLGEENTPSIFLLRWTLSVDPRYALFQFRPYIIVRQIQYHLAILQNPKTRISFAIIHFSPPSLSFFSCDCFKCAGVNYIDVFLHLYFTPFRFVGETVFFEQFHIFVSAHKASHRYDILHFSLKMWSFSIWIFSFFICSSLCLPSHRVRWRDTDAIIMDVLGEFREANL